MALRPIIKISIIFVKCNLSWTFISDSSAKSSFLAGFGMGVLAFFLKKLMLPVFIGAQLITSGLVAMFLPTVLGGLGKLAGKGLSTFSGLSSASTGKETHPEINYLRKIMKKS